jgi:hypothetical protein
MKKFMMNDGKEEDTRPSTDRDLTPEKKFAKPEEVHQRL